jgi:hypothetical protein
MAPNLKQYFSSIVLSTNSFEDILLLSLPAVVLCKIWNYLDIDVLGTCGAQNISFSAS